MITENGRKTRNSGSETELAHGVVIIMTHPYILISAHRSMMAERISPPSAKKAKRTAPMYRVSAEERAKQFKGDLNADGGVLFCKYCQHSIDYVHVDTIKVKAQKHISRKEAKLSEAGASSAASNSRQITLSSKVSRRPSRIHLRICTLADVPLEKTDKIRPLIFTEILCPGWSSSSD